MINMRRESEQRYSQHPGPFYIFRKPNPTLFHNRFHCMRGSRIDWFFWGGGEFAVRGRGGILKHIFVNLKKFEFTRGRRFGL